MTGGFTERGIKGLHGYMTEYVVDDAVYMNRVPEELRPVGVLAEPLTIAEKGLAQVWDIQSRLPWNLRHNRHPLREGERAPEEPGRVHTAVVLGAGPVGLLGAMLLLYSGFKTYIYSREPQGSAKSELAEKLGAVYVSAADASLEKLAGRTGNIDLVYEATGAAKISYEMMKYLGVNGVFVFTGVPGRKGPIAVDADILMRDQVLKNQVVFGTVNAGKADYEKSITDLGRFRQKWPGALEALITGRFAPEKHRDLLLGDPGGIKNIVTFA